MKNTIAVFILALALCTSGMASNGNGSGQDNSPDNPITNHGTDNGQGNGGVNNGNQGGNSNPGTPGNGGNGGNGGQGGNGGNGGQGGKGGSSSSTSSSTAVSVSSSSSTSSSSAKQNQGQVQGQQQSQSANNDGNKQATTINQNQVRQAPTAYAPDAFPSAPCRVSGSAGVSAPIGGISFGGSKLDTECDKRETARAFALIGQTDSACQILLTTRAAKAAGITSCVRPEPVVVAAPVVSEVPPTPVAAPEAPAPPAIVVIPVTVTLQNPPVALPVLAQSPRKRVHKKAKVAPCKYTINVCVE
jgi:hypothetical protein